MIFLKLNMVMRSGYIGTLFVFILLFLSGYSLASSDTTWYSRSWKKTNKEDAAYYRPKMVGEGNVYRVKDYYKSNGQLQMNGLSSAPDSDIKQGYFYFYDSLGNVASEGAFKDDKKIAVWKYYYAGAKELRMLLHYNKEEHRDAIFYRSGMVKMTGSFDHRSPSDTAAVDWRQGYFYYYDSLGNVSSEGAYKDDKKINLWKYYYVHAKELYVAARYSGEMHSDTVFYESGVVKMAGSFDNKPAADTGGSDLRQGYFYYFDTLGKVRIEGSFKDNKKTKVWKYYHPQSKELREVAHYGKEGCTDTVFYRSGVVKMTVGFENKYPVSVDSPDLKQGYFYYYDSLGYVRSEGAYKDNGKVATWKYYYVHAKELREVSHYGRDQYRDTIFYKTGAVKMAGSFDNKLSEDVDDPDIRQGYFSYYDSLGNVISEGTYKDNIKTDTWKYYYDQSKLLREVDHHSKEEFRDTLFYKSGVIKRVESYEHELLADAFCFDSTGKSIAYFPYGVMPQFDGDINQYLAKHIRYPGKAKQHKEQGEVVIRFLINPDGSIHDVEVINSVSELLDKEAVRLIAGMPRWKPGYEDGKPAKVYFTQAITFSIR